jgi:hypothetical protein
MALTTSILFENYTEGQAAVVGVNSVVATSGTAVATSAAAFHGSFGLHTSAGGVVDYACTSSGTASVYGRVNTTGSASAMALCLRNGGTYIARIRALNTSNLFDIADQGSTSQGTSAGVWANGTKWRLDIQWTYAAPNITVTLRVFLGITGTGSIEDFTPASTVGPVTFAAVSAPNRVSLGPQTVTWDLHYDTLRIYNDTSAWPTPFAGTAPSATGVPAAVSANTGAWVDNAGGTTGLITSQTDALDSTYIAAPTTTGGHPIRYQITPMIAGASASITARMALSGAVTDTTVVNLYEGSTLRQTWTHGTDFGPVTTTITDYVLAFSTGTIAAITDWTNLYLEYVWTA